MNFDAHNNIFRGAFEALPADMKQNLESYRPLLEIAGNYPDIFDDGEKPDSKKNQVDPDWKRFTSFPASLGGPNFHRLPWPLTGEQGKWRALTRHWLGNAVEALRSGDREGFMKFMGCLSHWFGDITQSAHLMDLALLKELLPPPDSMKDFHYHTDLEAVTGECAKLRPPKLLGESLEEVAWNMARANAEAIHESRRTIIPLLQAIFAGKKSEAALLAGPPVTKAAELTMDVLYTGIRLAEGSASPEEKKTLSSADLRLIKPEAEFHDSVYGGALLDQSRETPPWNGKNIPAELVLDDGKIKPVRGLGMLPHSGMYAAREAWMKFSLPSGVFKHFESWIGMHAVIGKEGAASFSVSLDGKEVFRSGRKNGIGSAERVKLPLGNASELTIKVEDANDGKSFWNNHVIWGEPKLVK